MECRERVSGPQGEKDTEDSAANSEKKAFDEHLALQASARGSQGEADSHIALTACGLGEEQIGNICTGYGENEQHHYGERGKKHEHGAAVPWRQGAGLLEYKAATLVCFRIGFGEAGGESIKLGCSLLTRDTGIEACNNVDPVEVPRTLILEVGSQWAGVAKRHPEFGIQNLIDAVEHRRCNADNGE